MAQRLSHRLGNETLPQRCSCLDAGCERACNLTAGKAPGAQFEISIDGKVRSHSDRREVAIQAAEFLKRKKHLPSVQVTSIAYDADTSPR